MNYLKCICLLLSFILTQTIQPQSKTIKSVNSDSIKTAEEALKLINTPEPSFIKSIYQNYNSSQNSTYKFKQIYKSEPYKFLMRDGKYLFAQKFKCNSNLIIVMLHGVLSSNLETNNIGVHKYDYLPVLFFNLPAKDPLRKYTYRSDQSMSPDDYKEGLHAIHQPLLVLVGSKDEAFNAKAFIPAVKNNSSGEVYIIKGTTHNGILKSNDAIKCVKPGRKT